MDNFVLDAQPRSDTGSRAARRMRAEGLVPANIYGHKEDNVLVSLDAKAFRLFFEAGHRIVTLRVGEKNERNVVKAVQYDSMGSDILHVDFTRIGEHERIEMEVPVEQIGIPKGVASGGVLEVPLKDVLVSGPADAIPEHIAVNVEALEVGQALRIKDLPVPDQCEFVQEAEQVVLHITSSRETDEEGTEGEVTQPEVIGKAKADDEGAES